MKHTNVRFFSRSTHTHLATLESSLFVTVWEGEAFDEMNFLKMQYLEKARKTYIAWEQTQTRICISNLDVGSLYRLWGLLRPRRTGKNVIRFIGSAQALSVRRLERVVGIQGTETIPYCHDSQTWFSFFRSGSSFFHNPSCHLSYTSHLEVSGTRTHKCT